MGKGHEQAIHKSPIKRHMFPNETLSLPTRLTAMKGLFDVRVLESMGNRGGNWHIFFWRATWWIVKAINVHILWPVILRTETYPTGMRLFTASINYTLFKKEIQTLQEQRVRLSLAHPSRLKAMQSRRSRLTGIHIGTGKLQSWVNQGGWSPELQEVGEKATGSGK